MRLALSLEALRSDTRPRWVLAGAALDLDFEAGRYWAGRVLASPEALPGWTSGAPLISGDGLVCDGATAWRAALPDWAGNPEEGLTVRAEVTETQGAESVGYLVILHAGSLTDRVAVLTARSALSTRVTRDGAETFIVSAAVNASARYTAVLGVKPGDGRLATGENASAEITADPPPLNRFEIGGFNSSLPLDGVVHRLTLWRGRLSDAHMDSLT